MALISGQNNKAWPIALVLVVVLVLFLLYKPKTEATSQATPQQSIVRIAVPDLSSSSNHSSGNPLVDYLYLHQLIEKKLAAKNIKVEWMFFKGAGPAINEALANNQLDFAYLGDLAAIIGKANHIDTRLLVATGREIHAYLGVQPNQGYDHLQQLKGKRIAIWQGTAIQLSFDQYIAQHGFSEKDFRIVNLDPAAANAALTAKQIDAAWGLNNLLALKAKNIIDIPLSTREQNNGAGTIISGFIGRGDFIKAHADITQDIVDTIVEAAHWVSLPENRQAALDLVTQNAGFPKALYESSIQHQQLKEIYNPHLDDYYLARFNAGIATALKAKLIQQGFDVNQWAEPKFVNQAIQQLKYQSFWSNK